MILLRKNNKWSKQVSENSNVLDLESGVFSLQDPKKIAESLKRSAEQSERRKRNTLPIGNEHAKLLYQPSWKEFNR